MKESKSIKIEIIYDNEGKEMVNFTSEGFNEFEIIGLLTYYRDKTEIVSMQKKSKIKPKNQ